jgi:hypothetical protein
VVEGTPASSTGRIEVMKCREKPNVVYSLFEDAVNNNAQLYKSSNSGVSWKFVNNVNTNGSYSTYCLLLGVHSSDTNLVIAGGVVPRVSVTGGQTWQSLKNSHSDYHTYVPFNGDQNSYLIGNDGGVYRYKWNDKDTFADLNVGYNTVQFYGGGVFSNGSSVVGGTQDNGTHRILYKNHRKLFGADGGVAHVSFQDSNLGYIETQNGAIRRSYNMSQAIPTFSGISAGITDNHYFISPFEMNPSDGKQLYFLTTGGLWRTVNSGTGWTKLTNVIGQLYTIHIEGNTDPRIYFGGGQAKIYRIDNAATTAVKVEKNFSNSVPALVTNDVISGISGNDDSLGLLQVSFGNYSNNPKIYKVRNAHTDNWEWIDISGDMPIGLPVNMVIQDAFRPNFIYAATDFGLYYSDNGGVNWLKEKRIPNVAIHQMRYRKSDNSLFLFTHGRGIWQLGTDGETVGGVQIAGKPAMKIYPNPSQGAVTVEGSSANGNLIIYDLKGVKRFETPTNGSKLHLNLSQLSGGVYLAVFQENSSIQTFRLVITNP